MATKQSFAVNHHQGRALLLIGEMYPTVPLALFEAVQNALDGNASRIEVDVNLKACTVAIRDNGDGVTRSGLKDALSSVLVSSKTEKGKLGQFGMGLLALLGKCEYFTFTSCHKSSATDYSRWTFETESIRAMSDTVTIPVSEVNDLICNSKGKSNQPSKKAVWWRTEVSGFNISPDKLVGGVDADDVRDGIISRFSLKMLENDASIRIRVTSKKGGTIVHDNVKARLFCGKALEARTYRGEKAGITSFELYMAPRSTRNAGAKANKVINLQFGIAGDMFRVPAGEFLKSAGDMLPDPIKKGLMLGTLEGVILADKCKLHPNRKGFVVDEAFAEFCEHLLEWYVECGSRLIDSAESDAKDQRYLDTAQQALETLKGALDQEALAKLREAMRSYVEIGSVGDGHARVSRTRTAGLDQIKALTERAGRPVGPPEGEAPAVDTSNRKEDKSHISATIHTDKGHKRQMVRGKVGLAFSHSEMPNYPYLWRFYPKDGMVEFNTRHPNWVACERSTAKLRALQVFSGMQALSLFLLPIESHEQLMPAIWAQCDMYVATM